MAGGQEKAMFSFGKKRFVAVSEFRNQSKIDLREYYENGESKLLPTKKGISLSWSDWVKIKNLFPEIDQAILDLELNIK
jgi:hypothetical protein